MEPQTQTDAEFIGDEPRRIKPKLKPGEAMWSVKDLNAREWKRRHDIGKEADLQSYWLSAYTPEQVPEHHARAFLKEGFQVFDEHGHLVDVTPRDRRTSLIDLPPGFCVAAYSELSKDALTRRVREYPDGAKANVSWKVDELVDFLMQHEGGKPTEDEKADAEVAEKQAADSFPADAEVEIEEADDDGDADFAGRILPAPD